MTYLPIPLFRRVTADILDDTFNALVNDINARLLIINNGGGLPVLISQLKQGLATADPGPEFLVADNIPPSPYNAINIGWTGTFIIPGDSLYSFVQTQLSYNSAQMLIFYLECAAKPVTP